MNTNSLIRKCLVNLVVFLCVGITIAPGLSQGLTRSLHDDTCVEITTQACGLNGYEKTTVLLTQRLFKELQEYLDGFRTRLNQSTNLRETTSLFDEAIVELDKYTLLPEGMTVEQAQSLINRNYQYFYTRDVFNRSDINTPLLNDSNFFCLLAGETLNNTRFFSIPEIGCSILCWSVFLLSYFLHPFISNPVGFNATLSFLTSLRSVFYRINSARITGAGILAFGHFYTSQLPPPYHYEPAEGWMTTQGMLGKKSWNGSFFGDVLRIVPYGADSYAYYTGAVGFIGLKIDRGTGNLFFVGSALYTKIQYA